MAANSQSKHHDTGQFVALVESKRLRQEAIGRVAFVKPERWDMRASRLFTIVLASATLLVVVGGLPFYFLFGHVIEDWVHRQTFDAKIWRSHLRTVHSGDWPPRLCMVDDLILSGCLNGMTETQVIQLLGPPDNKSHPLSYYLGPERGWIRIDSETLMIDFGPDGTVNRQWIHRD